MTKFATQWASGEPFSEKEKQEIDALHKAGCNCWLPLLGYRPNVGPRCRVCNTEAITETS